MKPLILAALLTTACGAHAQEMLTAPTGVTVALATPATTLGLSGQSNADRMRDLWTAAAPDSFDVAFSGAPVTFWDAGGQEWTQLDPLLLSSRLKAFVWWQGETEAEAGMPTADYLARLQSLMARVRLEQRNPTLRLVVVRILDFTADGKEAGYLAIRAAQEQFVATDINARLIDVDGLPCQCTFNPHLVDEGYAVAIQRILAAVE